MTVAGPYVSPLLNPYVAAHKRSLECLFEKVTITAISILIGQFGQFVSLTFVSVGCDHVCNASMKAIPGPQKKIMVATDMSLNQ